MKNKDWLLGTMFVILIGFIIFGLRVDLTHRFGEGLGKGLALDGLFMLFWLLVLYFLYEKLNFNFETYFLLCLGMLLHLFGDLWWYGKSWGFLQFDMITHFFLGIVLCLIMYRFLMPHVDKKTLIVTVILASMGLAAIHEILEFLGYSFLGTGSGIFMYGVGDFGEYNDICLDLISNFLGSIAAVIYSKFRYK